MLIEILFGAFLVWYLVKIWKLRKFNKLYNETRISYTSLPIIGHAHKLIGNNEDNLNCIKVIASEAMQSNHGLVTMWFGMDFVVSIADAEVAKIITNTYLEKFYVQKMFRSFTGFGGIFAPVQIWRRRRKIMMPGFSQNNLNLFVRVFEKHSTILANKMASVANGETFCIRSFIDEYNFNSVHETVLGVEHSENAQQFVKAFKELCELAANRLLKPWLHKDIIYKCFPMHWTTERHRKYIWEYIEQKIREKREALKTSDNNVKGIKKESGRTTLKPFLESLMEVAENDLGFTDTELREESLVLLLAAIDTSAVGISFVCLMLSKYPDIQDKVYKEILEVFGDSDIPIESDDIPKLKYLEAVIKETLRLYPPVPITAREATKDLKLPSGITIVEGCGVLINNWAINRNPKYWGEDAEDFKPDRWFKEDLIHPAAFISFSYGVRNCPGSRYMTMSARAVLSTLLRRYRFVSASSPEKRHEPLRLEFNIMMNPINGFPVKLIHREGRQSN